jgi:hypothetical protein
MPFSPQTGLTPLENWYSGSGKLRLEVLYYIMLHVYRDREEFGFLGI